MIEHLTWEEYALKSAEWHDSQRERLWAIAVRARKAGRKELADKASSLAFEHGRLHAGTKYVYVGMQEARKERDRLEAEVDALQKQCFNYRFGKHAGLIAYWIYKPFKASRRGRNRGEK